MKLRGFLPVLGLALATAAPAASAELPSAADFAAPPRAARPELWYLWINNNLDASRIPDEMSAIAAAGFRGIQCFHGRSNCPPWPTAPQAKAMGEDWWRAMGVLGAAAASNGLDLAFQNCPGWSMSGGPWVPLDKCMRNLSYSRVDCLSDGVTPLEALMPVPSNPPAETEGRRLITEVERDYRDLFAVAFPTPADDAAADVVPVSVAGGALEKTYRFARPVTLRTLVLPPPKKVLVRNTYHLSHASVRVEAKAADGWREAATYRIPAGCWQDEVPMSFALDEATADEWRVTMLATRPAATALPTPRFYEGARLNNWEGRAAWVLRGLVPERPVRQSPAAWVRASEIRDVSDRMSREGRIRGLVLPAGRWTILRIGHINNGAWNIPAPPEVVGWECDKLDPKGVECNYAAYVKKIVDGPFKGKATGLLVDSWECRRQTWSAPLDRIYRGPDGLDRRLVSVFGFVVDSPAATTAFLRDWRENISRLVDDNYFARLVELGHRDGLRVFYETAHGDVFPGDILRYWKYADEPMCEFWHPHTADEEDGNIGSYNVKPFRPCVSASHVYGKGRVSAESFTSIPLRFTDSFHDLKGTIDRHFARGLTHPVCASFTHDARAERLPPGSAFGRSVGTPFLPSETWWRHLPLFTAYLGRCQLMLEAGRPVVDVLWYLGDALGTRPDENHVFPEGYKYDYVNSDALFSRFTVKGGRLENPEGYRYRVLWIPSDTWMKPESADRLAALKRAGARIVRGSEAALADALASAGIAPDVIVPGRARLEPARDDFAWYHRADEGKADWYFVCAPTGGAWRGRVTFRAQGPVAAWNPSDGTRQALAGRTVPNGTELDLDLPEKGSLFIVFGDAGAPAPSAVGMRRTPVGGPWTLSFTPGWDAPASVTLDRLVAWKDIAGFSSAARAYSGTVVYRTAFDLADAGNGPCVLDLGRCEAWAAVRVNGRTVATLWTPPYRCDIAAAVKVGRNELEIEVTSPWHNRLVYDAGQPEAQRKTWTICGPKADAPLLESGLLGPVTLCR